MALNGSLVLISVNTGDEITPAWSVIPCQTSGEYSLSVGTLDTSCKDSADATNEPGRRERTLSVESIPTAWPALVASPAGAEQIIRDAAESGTKVQVQIGVSGSPVEEGEGTITSYSVNAADQEPTTVSLEIAVSGALTPVP